MPSASAAFGSARLKNSSYRPGDHALPAFGVVDAADQLLDVVVEVIERRGLGSETAGIERLDHRLHDLRHRVASGELPAAEQGVEYRPGDQVLGEHLNRVVLGHGIVEVVPDAGQELVEAGDRGRVLLGVLDQSPDPGLLGGRDLGDVLSPSAPCSGGRRPSRRSVRRGRRATRPDRGTRAARYRGLPPWS